MWKMLPQACKHAIVTHYARKNRTVARTLRPLLYTTSSGSLLFFYWENMTAWLSSIGYSKGHLVFHSVAFWCKIAHKVWCLSQDISWHSMAFGWWMSCAQLLHNINREYKAGNNQEAKQHININTAHFVGIFCNALVDY